MKKSSLIFLAALILSSINVARADHELSLPANELGQVMVLMYHHIDVPEAAWCRTPENFKNDLELLYSKGYYLVNTADLSSGKLNVPAGKTPVVLTFDDTAVGQIQKKNGEWDPNSAVGIINAMYEKHHDFGRAGSFYLNEINRPDLPAMVREMVELGYELGNHTVDHPKLIKLDQPGVEKEIANLQLWIEKMVPGYLVRTMAMPFGIYPKSASWAEDGEYNGVRYHNEILLEVGSAPSVSPYSKNFHALHVPRVRGSDLREKKDDPTTAYIAGAVEFFEHHPESRFISDGNPSTVTVSKKRMEEVRKDLPSGLKVLSVE